MVDDRTMIIGSFADVCVADVARSMAFYRALLGLEVIIDHGWYGELGGDGATSIAFVERGHETVPLLADRPPGGILLSFVVADAAVIHAAAADLGCPFLVEPVTELGQHHFMIIDPDGAIIDVIERTPLTPADLRRLVRLRRERA
jgi:catechol 2,3-dioxygenase-like lactoylglutathione lyase family enzyme